MLYLVQTDTTAGFLSKNFAEINRAKNRDLRMPCILTMAYFSELLRFVRVPKVHKNLVRKARKTSFVYVNLNLNRTLKKLNAEFSNDLSENLANFDENLVDLKGFDLINFKGTLACRVVKDCTHSEFLRQNGAFFSSSANLHGENFNPQKARQITLLNGGKIIDETLFCGKASTLIRLFRAKRCKIR